MKVAGYIRVSTLSQVATGESLSTQADEIKRFTENKGWELVETFEDKGLSGSKAENRPGFMKMIKDAERGLYDGIVFSRFSRFARNAGDFLNYQKRLKISNVQLFSIKEGIDPSTNPGKLMMGFMALIADWERENIREQMSENKIAKWADNRTFIGKPPFGYIWNQKTKQLEVNKEEEEIYHMFLPEDIISLGFFLK